MLSNVPAGDGLLRSHSSTSPKVYVFPVLRGISEWAIGIPWGLNRLREKARFGVKSVECAVPGLKPDLFLLALCGG